MQYSAIPKSPIFFFLYFPLYLECPSYSSFCSRSDLWSLCLFHHNLIFPSSEFSRYLLKSWYAHIYTDSSEIYVHSPLNTKPLQGLICILSIFQSIMQSSARNKCSVNICGIKKKTFKNTIFSSMYPDMEFDFQRPKSIWPKLPDSNKNEKQMAWVFPVLSVSK